MRNRRLWVSWCLLSAAIAARPASGSPPSAGPDDAAKIRKLEYGWMSAVRSQDVAAIDRILAPDYTFTVAVAGAPLSPIERDAYLRRVKGYVVHESNFEEIVVRVYRDVAVVTSRYTQRAVLHGRDRSAEFVLTDTWVRLDGQWLAAARVSSRPEPASTRAP